LEISELTQHFRIVISNTTQLYQKENEKGRNIIVMNEFKRKDESSVSSLKVILFGTILIIISCFWIATVANRIIWEITDFSIFPTVIFTLFILALLNLLSKKYLKFSLKPAELSIIYVMLSIATGLVGHDMIRQLVPMIGNAFWYATPENEWKELFFQYIPDWLVVEDKKVLEGYYQEESNFWIAEHIHAWLTPVLAWSAFTIVMLFVMVCINIVIRKQWTEYEKLSYPIIRLPLEISTNTSNFFSNRLMWIGAGVAALLELLTGLHSLYPFVPTPRLDYNIGRFFTDKPWNAMGAVPIEIHPFAVGIGFFMPLDLSFSLWFFWVFWKIQRVIFSVIGWSVGGGWLAEQRGGAWLGIGILALWTAKRHIKRVFLNIFSKDRSYEPLSRLAFGGLIFGALFLILFWHYAGMSLWVIVSYFGIYFILSLALTRMRAELGPPTHELHNIHPDRMMSMVIGTKRFGPRNLTLTTLTAWIAYGYRCHPMPHQLEGFKISERLNINAKKIVLAMIVAAVVGTFASILAHLTMYYRYTGYAIWGTGPFGRLQNWLNYPTMNVNSVGTKQMGFGLFFTGFLMIMRRRFLWWPFHPVGYAVGDGWAIGHMWFSVFISWLAKRTLVSLGGLGNYRKMTPLFMGLILGQFFIGSLWTIIGLISQRWIYSFFG